MYPEHMKQALVPQTLNTIPHRIENFKVLPKDKFNAYCETGLYILKFHRLDHAIEYLGLSGCSEMLSSSLYELFGVHIKQVYCSSS